MIQPQTCKLCATNCGTVANQWNSCCPKEPQLLGMMLVCEMSLSCGVCHSASPLHASSGLFLWCWKRGWGKGKSKASSAFGVSWKRETSFPAEWACCTVLPVCVEFRWERKRVYLLASAFLTTINLGVWAINIMFPPIHVSLAGKCSWQTESKAEFAVTVVGRAGGALSEGQITFCDLKKTPLEHAEQNLTLRFTGSYS